MRKFCFIFADKFEQAFNLTRQFWSLIGLAMDPPRNDTVLVTETPSGGDNNGNSDKTTKGVSAGLIGGLVFIVVIIVIIIIRRRSHKHRRQISKESEDSEAEMDSLEDVAVYQDSDQSRGDIVVCRDGRKLSRRKLIESLWVEDDNLRSVMKRYLVESNKLELGRMLGKGKRIF